MRFNPVFLQTYQLYDGRFEEVWLWSDFPYRGEFGSGQDIGIDLVCKTSDNEYWAVQCKCYGANTAISKDDVDSFLSASGERFRAGPMNLSISRTGYGFPPRIDGARMPKSPFIIRFLKSPG